MNAITTILFGPNKGINVLSLDWDHLIVLDACRCDIFKYVYRKFFPSATRFRCITSPGSSTMEFVRKNLDDNVDLVKKKLKDAVFVNSNPVIDHVLGVKTKEIFYRYIPVWKHYWDDKLGTVKPEDTYYTALRAYIRNPKKKLIIWFLQPHYPYIDKRFSHINVIGREFMNKALYHDTSNNLLTLIKIAKNLVKRGYLCAGIPDRVCGYIHKKPLEVVKAYVINLIKVLQYVKKLTEILPGRIVITSDHGEALGEPLNVSKLSLYLRVYGHPSRIHIPSTTQLPLLVIENNLSQQEALRRALKFLVHHSTANKAMQ